MANAETARLIASLELKDQFTPGINKALGGLGKLDAGITRSSGRAFKAGQQIGTGIKTGAIVAAGAIGFLATQVGFGLKSLVALESATAQTNAVLKSTKGVAGETAASIRNLAEKYESLNATIDDRVIQSGANVLLTFTNIRKQAFEPALAAALDLSTAMGTDLQGAIVQVGKALSDPVKGITALTRVGVTFTEKQKDQIKALVKTGDTLGAQKLILAELNKEFGGSFLAGGATTAGKIAKFQDSIEDLQKALASALLPTIGKVADGLSKFLADPQVVKGVEDLGKSIASLFSDKNLKAGGDFLKGAFQTAKEAAPVVTAAAKATFGLVQSAVGLFKSLPPEIQKLAVGAFAVNKLTGGLVTNIAGGIIETVGKNFLQKGGSPANPLFVSDISKGLGGAPLPGGGGSAISKVASLATKVFILGAAVGVFAELKGILDEQTARNNQQSAGLTADTNAFVKVAGIDDMKRALAGIEEQEKHLESTWSAEGFAFRGNIDGVKDAVHQQEQTLRDAITKAEGDAAAKQVRATERLERVIGGTVTDTVRALRSNERAEQQTEAAVAKSAKSVGGAMGLVALAVLSGAAKTTAAVRATTAALRSAKGAKDIGQAVKNALATIITKGLGGSGGAGNVLRELKTQLKNTHDPALQRALKSAISQVEHKMAARQVVEGQLRKADQIFKSNLTNAQKIEQLKHVQSVIGNRNVAATKRVQEKIDAAKKSQAAAAAKTTAAIKNKDLSVSLTIPVQVNSYLTNRESSTAQAIANRYYKVPT